MASTNYYNFSYFDQLKEHEIDLSLFLKNFSDPKYELKFSNLQPVKVKVKNLFEQYKIIERYKRDASSFTQYTVQDDDKIESISYKFYGTVDFWWIIAVFNDIKNPFFDFPLSEDQIQRMAKILALREGKYPDQVYYHLLFEENEEKRYMQIPRQAFISDIVWQFREELLKERNRR